MAGLGDGPATAPANSRGEQKKRSLKKKKKLSVFAQVVEERVSSKEEDGNGNGNGKNEDFKAIKKNSWKAATSKMKAQAAVTALLDDLQGGPGPASPTRGRSSTTTPGNAHASNNKGSSKLPAANKRGKSPSPSSPKKKNSAKKEPATGLLKEEHTYLHESQLKGFDDPDKVLKASIANMDCDKWRIEFAALDDIRTLIFCHSELSKPHLQVICRKVTAQLNNLRSSIVKNSILCCNTMFKVYGKECDKYLANMMPVLVRRSGETQNKFLMAEADQCCELMMQTTSTKKLLKYLADMVKREKGVQIKTQVSKFLCLAIQQTAEEIFSSKNQADLQETIDSLGLLVQDRTPETRDHAKEAVRMLGMFADKGGAASQKGLKIAVQNMPDKLRSGIEKEVNGYEEQMF